MAVAVLPPMKQARLGFNAHASGVASSSQAPMMEVIVLDDSDEDDEFRTPPPANLRVQEKKKDGGTEPSMMVADGKATHKRIVPLQNEDSLSTDQPPAKKARANVLLEQSPHSQLLPDSEPSLSRPGEGRMCHQHRQPCSNLLQCTARKERYRCTMKYCYKTLAKVYKQDAGQIVSAGRNILGVKVDEHVGPSEASYLWKCPKCRGICQCSACRRQAGLEPLGIIHTNGEKQNGMVDSSDVELLSVTGKDKGKAKGDGKAKGKEKEDTTKALKMNEKKADGKIKGQPKKKKDNASLQKSFAKASETIQAQDAAPMPKPKIFMQQQTLPKPLHKPMEVDKPVLSSMRTRLPVENLKERIWLYESLIRFDWFDIPKSVLKNLDRFDDWTESQLQTILEKLICRVADISNIKNKPSRKIHQKLIETFKETYQDIKRGEAWEAAKKYCQHKGITIASLQDVSLLPHQIFDEKKSRQIASVPTETLLEGRLTRGRRLAQQRAMERAKAMSMRELQDSDESSLSSVEDESEASSGSESENDSEGDEEEEDGVSKRRSRRLNPVNEEIKRGGRRGKITLPPSEPSESEDDEEVPAQADQSKSETDSDVEVTGEVRSDGPKVAPPFEERVAILSGLVEVLMEKKAINEEITNGFKEAVLLEKAGKEEERELIAEQAQILQAHSNKAPSMLEVADFARWKEERNALLKKHAFDMIDIKVHTYLQMEAHKSRSGPLGRDVDGNEYWQLSEYNEYKPADVTGRWAWSLLVLGSDFYVQPADLSIESKEEVEAAEVTKEVQSGDGLALHSNERKEVQIDEDFVVLIDVPTARKSPVQTTPEKPSVVRDAEITSSEEGASSTIHAKESSETRPTESFGFSCTDDFKMIARLKEYFMYRLAMKEYEELLEARNAEQLEREQSFNASLEEQINAETQGDSVARGGSTLRAKISERKRQKAELAERHAERRKEVESLIKNLEMVRMYHQWHAGEEAETA